MKTWNRVRILLVLVVFFAATGTAGFHYLEGWSWFDSLYMVVITFSTVGYGEVHQLSHAGRVFNVAVIIAGVGLVYFAIGTLTFALLEFEFDKVFGRRRMLRDIDRLTDHYIICGAGRVGLSVGRELARQSASFVVIETEHAGVEHLDKEWTVLEGDATK